MTDLIPASLTSTLSELIPADSEPSRIVQILRSATQRESELRSEMTWIVPTIGRCMYLASINPKIYKAAGFKSFSAFADKELASVSHGTRFAAMRITRHLAKGDLTLADWQEAGTTNLYEATKVLPLNASKEQIREAVDLAKALPNAAYREEMERRYSAPGEMQIGVLVLKGSRAHVDCAQAFFDSVEAQDYFGTAHPLEMFVRLIAEGSTQFGVK